MKRLLLFLPLLLAACGIQAPPRDNAQWQSTVQGVEITYRATAPGALLTDLPIIGTATTILAGKSCVIDVDMALARSALTHLVAHEVGHCLQMHYLLPGIPRPDIGAYYSGGIEGFAETYAETYLRECGDSLKPLGWVDFAVPMCAEAPDPRRIQRP